MTWTIDLAHTEINFSMRHMMFTSLRGQFQKFTGEIEFDETMPSNTQVAVLIEVASLNTRDEKRDARLKSAEFFDVEKYPQITFHSKLTSMKDNTHAVVYGDLVIRDISHEVGLVVKYNGLAKSPWGSTNAGFSATTQLKRKNWDLKWNGGLDPAGLLVGDDIRIAIELEIVKQPELVPLAAVTAVAA